MCFMRKQLLSIILATTNILCSCSASYTNKIFKGKYIKNTSVIEEDQANSFLDIKPITKEEFDLSNKVNVVEDLSNKRCNQYYKFDLYTLDEENVRKDFYLIDLKPAPKKAHAPGSAIAYEDKDGNLFRPGASDGYLQITFAEGYSWYFVLEDTTNLLDQINCNT